MVEYRGRELDGVMSANKSGWLGGGVASGEGDSRRVGARKAKMLRRQRGCQVFMP